jgi:branched-chain amino acid transport system ATP-binding protein
MLHVENLAAAYGPAQVLFDISFAVNDGEVVTLIGRNGMGKTTTIFTLMGVVPPLSGHARFDGTSLIGLPPYSIAQAGIGLVPEGRGIFGALTVEENLTMAARPGSGGRQAWTLARIYELFPRLHQRRGNGGHQLSGGEQQMLTIGRALMTNPDLILIDEATEGLAPLVAQDIWKTLGVIRGEGIATIVVDKDFRSLARITDRAIVLSKGTVVFNGAPAVLMAKPELLERHLGV